jgi:hypothetical protein
VRQREYVCVCVCERERERERERESEKKNTSLVAWGMTPGDERVPDMVKVLPELVWPYAKMQPLYPSTVDCAAFSKVSALVEKQLAKMQPLPLHRRTAAHSQKPVTWYIYFFFYPPYSERFRTKMQPLSPEHILSIENTFFYRERTNSIYSELRCSHCLPPQQTCGPF